MFLACLLSLGLFLYNFKKFKEKALRSKKKKEKEKKIFHVNFCKDTDLAIIKSKNKNDG